MYTSLRCMFYQTLTLSTDDRWSLFGGSSFLQGERRKGTVRLIFLFSLDTPFLSNPDTMPFCRKRKTPFRRVYIVLSDLPTTLISSSPPLLHLINTTR